MSKRKEPIFPHVSSEERGSFVLRGHQQIFAMSYWFKLTHRPRPDEMNVGRRVGFINSASSLVGSILPKS